jgi:hypothetical protein
MINVAHIPRKFSRLAITAAMLRSPVVVILLADTVLGFFKVS